MNSKSNKPNLFELLPDLLDKKFGIVQRFERFYPDLTITSIYHYYSYMGNTKAFCNQQNIRYGKSAASTEERAQLKALGEGVERYSASVYDKNKLLLSTFNKIRMPALSCEDILSYSDKFYCNHLNYKKFHNDLSIRWTEAVDLATNEKVYVPAAMVYLPYQINDQENKIIQNISTGLASHVTYENAATNAICEVIERDAFMIHWRRLITPPKIDISTLPNNLQTILDNYRKCGFEISLYNITTDIKVPTIIALMESQRLDQPPLILSGACSLLTENAILSAIEELDLAREHSYNILKKDKLVGLSSPELVRTNKDHMLFWHCKENLQYINFIKNSDQFISFDKLSKLDIAASPSTLKILVNRVQDVGLDIYIADITSSDIASYGLSVVRAIIPKAHPLSFGYGYEEFNCPRLDTVPNYLGINNSAKLNLIPHPFP